MSKLRGIFEKENSTVKAAGILAFTIILVYSPIIFSDQTYDLARPTSARFYGLENQGQPLPTTIDFIADFQQSWPIFKLASSLIMKGEIPLWNPYIGAGHPLAADTVDYIFSPLALGYLLPAQYWDLYLLVGLWIAGIFTYLFLRDMGLNFAASMAGGIFLMLSGSFTWFLTHTHFAVMVFTPFIFYSLEKIIQKNNQKYIALASTAFAFGILGAHLESVILQILFVGLYLIYRILYIVFSRYRSTTISTSVNNVSPESDYSVKRILIFSFAALFGGLGLSAFFTMPVYEFLKYGNVAHSTIEGLDYSPLTTMLSNFVPYSLGPIQVYWSEALPTIGVWNGMWGYVGVLALFFSILAVILSIKSKSNIHKFTPLFFVGVSTLFIMKSVGVPLVNLLGALPLLDYIYFSRHVGVIIPFGFAVAAAFGIDLLIKKVPKLKHLTLACIVSASVILLLLIPYIPAMEDSRDNFTLPLIQSISGKSFFSFQVVQSLLILFLGLLTSIAVTRNPGTVKGIIPLVLLELSIYIPFGLDPLWMIYKSIITLSGMSVIVFFLLKPNKLRLHISKNVNLKSSVIIAILLITMAGGTIISESSPLKMVKRHDPFQVDDLMDFLNNNVGNYRIFGLVYALVPNYSAAYQISTIGIISASEIESYYSFYHNFLDSNAWDTVFGHPTWTQLYSPQRTAAKFIQSEKYMNFLGVKYVLIGGFALNNFTSGSPLTGYSAQIKSNENSIGQSFVSPFSVIRGISIPLYLSSESEASGIKLTLDSIPKDPKFHREVSLNASEIKNNEFNLFKLDPPLTDSHGMEFYISLRNTGTNSNEIVYLQQNNSEGYNIIKQFLNGKFYKDGSYVEGSEMNLSIVNSEDDHIVFRSDKTGNVYQNTKVLPRAYLVKDFQIVKPGHAQDFLLANPNFDLRNTVILENPLPTSETKLLNLSNLNETYVKISSYSANNVLINVRSGGPSLLVLTDTYYPGWKAYVDGQETPIYRADGLVRAVFVPSGEHLIEFSYLPQSFLLGLTVSFVTVGILILISCQKKLMRLARSSYNGTN